MTLFNSIMLLQLQRRNLLIKAAETVFSQPSLTSAIKELKGTGNFYFFTATAKGSSADQ